MRFGCRGFPESANARSVFIPRIDEPLRENSFNRDDQIRGQFALT